MTEQMGDAALDARLKAHFEDAASAHDAPDFAAQIALAEAQLRRPQRHRIRNGVAAIAAVAAGALLVVLVSFRDDSVVLDAADEQLVIELTASTIWSAPSDRWLEAKGLEILATPNFDDMVYSNALNQSTGGVTSWW